MSGLTMALDVADLAVAGGARPPRSRTLYPLTVDAESPAVTWPLGSYQPVWWENGGLWSQAPRCACPCGRDYSLNHDAACQHEGAGRE
ncbi:MAG TPA: hypothetical protein VLC09_20135 [Polyangiaceae bacterium]|nr:hypothetical protein [Polyangiaceae bacterium]